jgi:hypothetical protein
MRGDFGCVALALHLAYDALLLREEPLEVFEVGDELPNVAVDAGAGIGDGQGEQTAAWHGQSPTSAESNSVPTSAPETPRPSIPAVSRCPLPRATETNCVLGRSTP